MKLLLVRHAETEGNVAGIIQGQSQGTLTEQGRRQSTCLASRLKEVPIDKVFCSDLGRVRDTLEYLLELRDLEVEYTEVLRERSFGGFEGRPIGEYREERLAAEGDRATYSSRGGESFLSLKERLAPFVEMLFAKYQGKTVALFSHGGTIVSLISLLLSMELSEALNFKIANTSISFFEFDSSRKVLHYEVNEVGHLLDEERAMEAAAAWQKV